MTNTRNVDWLPELNEGELLIIAQNPENFAKIGTLDEQGQMRLSSIAKSLRREGAHQSIDHLGNHLLPTAIRGFGCYAVWSWKYWQRFKDEFKLFICTSDKKYAGLRRKVSRSADKSQTAIVSTIAAGMAAQFGVVAGLLVPFVALCLVVLARTGKEAFCATLEWSSPLIADLKSEAKKD